MSILQKPRGTQDIYGKDIEYWHFIEDVVRDFTHRYQFKEIRTPMFEATQVFARGVGETSDIVSKEMYEFKDKGDRSMVLKPESTAAVVRSYIENKLYVDGDYQKFYYISPHFRYERAQAGRYRQHHQFGVETFGEENPQIDAETILFAHTLLTHVGLKDYTVQINSIGDNASRIAYRERLQEHFRPHLETMCADCQVRFEKNPLRMLDCKKDQNHEAVLSAPEMFDSLNDESKTYINEVIALLDAFSVPYNYNQKIVRGLDYYTHTVFEFMMNDEESAKAGTICAGGRYDGLVKQSGGPEKSGMGFGMGIERLILALQDQKIALPVKDEKIIYVANLVGGAADVYTMEVVQSLRSKGYTVDMNYSKKSMKAIFKQTERISATDLFIVGEDEFNERKVSHRNLETREQALLDINDIINF